MPFPKSPIFIPVSTISLVFVLEIFLATLMVLLIEELLRGEEMSYFIVSDGSTIKNFGNSTYLLKFLQQQCN